MEIQVNGKTIKFGDGCNFIKIDELVPYSKNPKNHYDKDIDLIVKSIERNGFGENLLICPETNEILSGNGRYLAAKKIGLSEVPVVYAPKGLSEKQKADLVIASNKLVEISDYNNYLGELLSEFDLSYGDYGMIEPTELDIDSFFTDAVEKEKKKKTVICPDCGKEFEI